MLGEIYQCWAEGWKAEASVGIHPSCEGMQLPGTHSAACAVAEAMVGLARTSRYELNISLMSADELDALRSLCDNVRSTLQAETAAAEADGEAASGGGSSPSTVLAQFVESYSAYLQEEATEQLP